MDIMNYFSENHAHLFYLIAGLSLIIELTILGLSGPLLFIALASVLTGVFINIGLLSSWESEIFFVGVLSGLSALLLWKPMKRFQNSSTGVDTSSDMIGKQVPSASEITRVQGSIRFSGINWNARLASNTAVQSIEANTQCIITGVDGNVMLVTPLS